MPRNNLRIIHNNIADTVATQTASTEAVGYLVTNTRRDTKGLVWRTTTRTATTTLTWATNQTLNSVVLAFTNLTGAATIRIRLYSDTAATVLLSDTGTVTAVPAVLDTINTASVGNFRYSYGGGTTARRYVTRQTTVRSMIIDLSDAANPDPYIEVSRLIIGDYWSPVYNTSFGISLGIVDNSEHSRTQAGNLLTEVGSLHKTLSLELNYLTNTDRNTLFTILRTNAKRRALYVSVFPEDDDPNKEVIHQIYGRLTNVASITHPQFSVYASSLDIEEV